MKKDSPEWKDWCELYEYVKIKVMGYSEDMKLPQFMVLRLKGLGSGKFMANKKQESMANYPDTTILTTFKICKGAINGYISRNQSKFKDEKHKFNGIMIIVENEINDVVMRLKKAEKSKDKIEESDLSYQAQEGAEYKKKDTKENKKLDSLW